MIMVTYIKQHLRNIWSSIHKKVQQHWGLVEKKKKKSVAYKKKLVYWIQFILDRALCILHIDYAWSLWPYHLPIKVKLIFKSILKRQTHSTNLCKYSVIENQKLLSCCFSQNFFCFLAGCLFDHLSPAQISWQLSIT